MRDTSLDEFIGGDGEDGEDGGEADGSEDPQSENLESENAESEDGADAGDVGEAATAAPADVGSDQESDDDGSQPAGDAETRVEPDGAECDPGGSEPEPEPELDSEPEPAPENGPDPDAVEPAVSTYDWTPGGAECQACGAAVERRWRDEDGLVCADCKAW